MCSLQKGQKKGPGRSSSRFNDNISDSKWLAISSAAVAPPPWSHAKIRTQDSGVNLRIYCCFWRVPVFWMDAGKPIRWFLHRSCPSADTRPLWGVEINGYITKPCRNSERHNHHTADNQIHQFCFVYIFCCGDGGRGSWRCSQAAISQGTNRIEKVTPQTFNAFLL